jgi:Mce-associated membrane protein
MSRTRLTSLGVLLAALALAVVATLLARSASADADARSDALAAAKALVPDLLSYENATLQDDLAHAGALTTGTFGADYRKILKEVVEPTATKQGISTQAAVSAAGIISGNRERVVALVFLTQTTTARGNHSAVSGSRVEVIMEREGDTWKIAGLKPV